MKHFIGYKSDGTFASVETYSHGWPQCKCGPECEGLASAHCGMPVVKTIREARRESNPEIVGFYAYDCPCSKEMRVCDCVSKFFGKHYLDVETKQPVKKYSAIAVFDGHEVYDGGVYSAPPGTPIALRLECHDAPDGTTITVDASTGSSVDIVPGDDTFELEFTGGKTPDAMLVAPAQGLNGLICASSKYFYRTLVKLRGWGN